MKEVVIVDAVRTPIGRYKGALKTVRPDDLGAIVIKALVDRNPSFLQIKLRKLCSEMRTRLGKTIEMWQECLPCLLVFLFR